MMTVTSNCFEPTSLGYHPSWQSVFQPSLDDFLLPSILQFVENQRQSRTVFPAAEEMFAAFRWCSLPNTKVVILGQDPYHGDGQAHGLAFSVPVDQRLPPSLRNIFKELQNDLGHTNVTGDLTGWARQGVLLLNTVLTVEKGKANSHRKKGWESFTDRVIEQLARRPEPMVFLLWGKQASEKATLIQPQHAVLQTAHPSPLSAHRGFFGSKPFSATNRYLQKFGNTPIEWSI